MLVFLVLLLVLLLLLLPMVLRLKVQTERGAVTVKLELLIFELIRIPLLLRRVTLATVGQSLRKKPGVPIKKLFRILRKTVQVEELTLFARIGTGSAASTALLSSQAFALAAPLALAAAGSENCVIDVTPVFDKKELYVAGECVFSTDPLRVLTGLARILGGKKHGKASD